MHLTKLYSHIIEKEKISWEYQRDFNNLGAYNLGFKQYSEFGIKLKKHQNKHISG